MTQKTGINSNETISRFHGSCPYIGLLGDPQTHVGIPDNRNFCHLVNPPLEVTTSHQQGFCLAQQFPECAIYQTSGEGPIPAEIFEEGERKKRSLKLPALLTLASRRKRAEDDEDDVQTFVEEEREEERKEVFVDQDQMVIVGLQVAEEAKDDVVEEGVTISQAIEPALPIPQPLSNPTPEPANPPLIAAIATQQKTVSQARSSEEAAILRNQLYQDAQQRYQQAGERKKSKTFIWLFVGLLALVVLLVVFWNIFSENRSQQQALQAESQKDFTVSLVTAVQGMGAAADAWGTAVAVQQAEQEATAAAILLLSQKSTEVAVLPEPTQTPEKTITPTATPDPRTTICQNINEAKLEIISGPALNPIPMTIYRAGMQNPQASWVVKNSGSCAWSQVLFWSMLENTIIQPVVKYNGQVVTPTTDGNPSLITPGDLIEVILEFPVLETRNISGEWVGVIDGLSLVTDPHFILDVENWIIVRNPERPNPTPTARRASPGGGSGGSTNPSVTEEPPPRP